MIIKNLKNENALAESFVRLFRRVMNHESKGHFHLMCLLVFEPGFLLVSAVAEFESNP